jgi:hypothetical protein
VAKAVEFVMARSISSRAASAGGADALDAEAEVVRVGRAHESFFESDQVARIEIEERLVEGLHAVLAGAGGDGVANQARFVGIDDAIADVAGADHHFNGGTRPLPSALRTRRWLMTAFSVDAKLQANLFLLGRRKDGDDALNRFGGVECVQGGEHQVAGFGGQQGGGNCFQVAHFADQDDVRVLAKRGAQSASRTRKCRLRLRAD